MDPRLLDYFNQEITYLREMGHEFSRAYPKVAGRLGMTESGTADPYVERLLEGFAFLSARVHLKMDAEFPKFSQRLLEVIYPHYLAPTPSMCVVQIESDKDQLSEAMGEGAVLPRGTQMRGRQSDHSDTRCTFVTGHDVKVWPISLNEVTVSAPTDDLMLHGVRNVGSTASVIKLKFGALRPGVLARCDLGSLTLFLGGDPRIASHLYRVLMDQTVAVLVSDGTGGPWQPLPSPAIHPEGFGVEQALLPVDSRVFQGYRLLHEYFAFPARFHFCTIDGLSSFKTAIAGDEFEIAILVRSNLDQLAPSIDRGSFVLNCTPAINLFPYRAGRVLLTLGEFEHHVVPDRTRPLDYEVYSIGSVQGFDRGNVPLTDFRPFYQSLDSDAHPEGAYFSMRREPRRLSESASRNGLRSAHYGSEVYLSLVDGREAPWNENIEQLAIEMLVTNRDLPALMPISGDQDFLIEGSNQFRHANILRGPSKPGASFAERETTWRLISHLSLNHLALKDLDSDNGAIALRELMGLYGSIADPNVARHGQAIESASIRPVTRRLPGSGPLVFGRGVGIEVVVDEDAFAGHSPYLFGCILEQYFCRHVSINLFTELALRGNRSGLIAEWKPRWGGRPDA